MVNLARVMMAAALASGLGACAVAEPLTVQSTGAGLTRSGAVALALDDAEAQSERGRFGTALARAFASHAVAVDPGGAVAADFGVALGDAAEGIVRGEASATPAWLAQPRKSRRFDKCKPQRLRATLVLFERASGAMIYRSSASRIECGFSDSDAEAMADALVRDAVKRVR